MRATSTRCATVEDAPNYRLPPGRHLRRRGDRATSCADEQPDAVMHLAAESHVDRSIDGPGGFVETNVVGTFRLLDAALDYWRGLDGRAARRASASTMSRPTRCSAPAARRRHLHRGDALRAVLALFGVQGGVRPSRARLARDLRPAGRALQLLEQLRAVSLSRKADPAGRSSTRSRASRCRSTARARTSATGSTSRTTPARSSWSLTQRRARRELQCRRPRRAQQPRASSRRSATSSTRSGRVPDGEPLSRPDQLRRRPAGPRPALRHRLRRRSSASSAGAPSESFESGLAETVDWYLDNDWWWRPIRERQLCRRAARRRRDEDPRHGRGRPARSKPGRTRARPLRSWNVVRRSAGPTSISAGPAARPMPSRRSRPDVVINAAAYTAVDQAEDEPELAMRINAEAPARSPRRPPTIGAPVIQLSTDYVFDGTGDASPMSRTTPTASARRLWPHQARRRGAASAPPTRAT